MEKEIAYHVRPRAVNLHFRMQYSVINSYDISRPLSLIPR